MTDFTLPPSSFSPIRALVPGRALGREREPGGSKPPKLFQDLRSETAAWADHLEAWDASWFAGSLPISTKGAGRTS